MAFRYKFAAKSLYMAFRSKFAAKSLFYMAFSTNLRLRVGAQANISKDNASPFPHSIEVAKFASVKN